MHSLTVHSKCNTKGPLGGILRDKYSGEKKHSNIESNLDTFKQLHLLVRNTLSLSPTHPRWLVEHELPRKKVSSCKLIFEQCFIALCYGREHTHAHTHTRTHRYMEVKGHDRTNCRGSVISGVSVCTCVCI